MLTKKGAYKLLKNVHFPGEENTLRDLKLAAAGKQSRRSLIHQKQASAERSAAAAIELQRVWRGHWTRCRLFEILNPTISTRVHQTGSRFVNSEQGLRDVRTTPSKSPEKSASKVTHVSSKESLQSKASAVKNVKTASARQRLEGYYGKYCHRKKTKGETDIISFEEFCAHYIQNWWHRIRRKRSMISTGPPYKGVQLVTISLSPEPSQTRVPPMSVKMQPKKKERKKKRTHPLDPKEAAKMIQRAWRRHIDVQVYRYYRDLINFRCRGDPSMMLRCINPKEAKLLDAAAGIHIKFRLAGARFPPNIYYKIFTHRNVVDMCANSPKDYTAAAAKRRAAKDVHNNTVKAGKPGRDDREGWYKRMENNGWRLVSDRLLLRPEQDPVTWESSNRKVEFPHGKLQRRQDVEKKKKQRKVEWMKKMYREGMLQAKTEDSDTKSLVEGAAAGMMAAIESQGSEVVEEWEVDELLEWTSGLNFDDYLSSWKELATSAGSEKFVEGKLKFETSQDPYEFSITLDAMPTPSRLTSLQQPKTSPAVSVQ